MIHSVEQRNDDAGHGLDRRQRSFELVGRGGDPEHVRGSLSRDKPGLCSDASPQFVSRHPERRRGREAWD